MTKISCFAHVAALPNGRSGIYLAGEWMDGWWLDGGMAG